MRGQYRVLKDLANIEIFGLQNVFDLDNMNQMVDPTAACRNVCLSILRCQYWQVHNSSGCWVEIPSRNSVAYPLTTANAKINTPECYAGELIQHQCPSYFF